MCTTKRKIATRSGHPTNIPSTMFSSPTHRIVPIILSVWWSMWPRQNFRRDLGFSSCRTGFIRRITIPRLSIMPVSSLSTSFQRREGVMYTFLPRSSAPKRRPMFTRSHLPSWVCGIATVGHHSEMPLLWIGAIATAVRPGTSLGARAPCEIWGGSSRNKKARGKPSKWKWSG